MNTPLLEVRGLEVRYGASQVVFGVDLVVGRGEIVALLGRNGMGKTTIVKTVMSMHPASAGEVRFDGEIVSGKRDFQVAQAGIGLVPEGRAIFPNLTVHENLVATARGGQSTAEPWTLERVCGLFPRLHERRTNLGSDLSGGEQQMLAIGRALMTNPRLLILDEATEGLAPLVRREIWHCLEGLKQSGLSMLVIDKNIAPMLRLADRHFILERGRVAWSGTSSALRENKQLLHDHIGV